MKIFTAAQIKACDTYTIYASHISSLDLMERAAAKCVEWVTAHFDKTTLFVVLCGTGNNGGDGLAITRMLHYLGFGVRAFQLQGSSDITPDCETNLRRVQNIDGELVQQLLPDTFITDIQDNIVIIDAIFGTGLNRPVTGWMAAFIGHINELPNYKLAIDIPSGMPADTIINDGSILRADTTLTFQFYKRVFLHPETGRLAGDVHVLDIGLDQTFINATHTNYQVTDKAVIAQFFKPRSPFSHKGTYGTAMMIGGSQGMIGAITLSIRAALRAGAGKVVGVIPECGYNILQTAVPEATCITNGEQNIRRIRNWEDMDAIGIGPGMGTRNETIAAFEEFLDAYKQPLVIDADALNMIGRKPELLAKIPPGSILTPHPKEFERIFGGTANSMLRLEHARAQAMRYNIVIVLKDRYTAIVTPEGECWYNSTGNAGLATGGSGDVLTGIITGLLAQKYESTHAAILGVYTHGLSAEYATSKQSLESMTAVDVIDYLGSAFKDIQQ